MIEKPIKNDRKSHKNNKKCIHASGERHESLTLVYDENSIKG